MIQPNQRGKKHADGLAKRIVELRGEPNFSPEDLAERSHVEYVTGTTLKQMITEDLIAERIAIESYRAASTAATGEKANDWGKSKKLSI